MKKIFLCIFPILIFGCSTVPETSENKNGDYPIPYKNEVSLEGNYIPVEELDIGPSILKTSKPTYPNKWKFLKLDASAIVVCIIDENGDPYDIDVEESTAYEFAVSAISSVSKWKFRPGIKDGKKVKTRVRVPVIFDVK